MKEPAKKHDTIVGPTGGVYLVIARRGAVALGIQMLGVLPGAKLGVAGHTWFGMKIRSAVDKADTAAGEVVSLDAAKVGDPETAWGAVKWDVSHPSGKHGPAYCSLTTGILLPGDAHGTFEGSGPLLETIGSGTLARRFAEAALAYVKNEADLVMTTEELGELLHTAYFATLAKGLEKAVEAASTLQGNLKENVGVFMTSKQLLKKQYEATQQGSGEEASNDGAAED